MPQAGMSEILWGRAWASARGRRQVPEGMGVCATLGLPVASSAKGIPRREARTKRNRQASWTPMLALGIVPSSMAEDSIIDRFRRYFGASSPSGSAPDALHRLTGASRPHNASMQRQRPPGASRPLGAAPSASLHRSSALKTSRPRSSAPGASAASAAAARAARSAAAARARSHYTASHRPAPRRVGAGVQVRVSPEAGSKNCSVYCRTPWRAPHGYPGVAKRGGEGQLLCPSMFRDMCDYVYDWPYDHFNEVVFLPGFADVVACLPAVPFIYAQPGPPTERFAKYMLPLLERAGKKFVFVTGQSAYGVPLKPGGVQQILASPALIRWFGQYPNAEHAKFEPLPVGLNCFEHAPELFRTLQQIGTYKQLVSPEHKSSLLMVNFSPKTNPIRKKLIHKYCHEGGFAHCFPKGQNNNIQGNPHLVAFYNNASRFKYALCPPGQGMDSHRTWEMLLLGVVPIVEHSRHRASSRGGAHRPAASLHAPRCE